MNSKLDKWFDENQHKGKATLYIKKKICCWHLAEDALFSNVTFQLTTVSGLPSEIVQKFVDSNLTIDPKDFLIDLKVEVAIRRTDYGQYLIYVNKVDVS